MNAATSAQVGAKISINNAGSNGFNLLANDGTTILYNGGISTGSITAGTGYVNGVYTDIPLTGGSGTGARATVTVSGTGVTGVVLTALGYNSLYKVGDTLSASNSNLGGSGSGFVFTITAMTGIPPGATLTATVTSNSTANGGFKFDIQGNVLASNNGLDFADTATTLTNLGGVTSVGASAAALQAVYPVGSLYISMTNSANPSTILGFGTWTALVGVAIVGAGTGTDSNGDTQTFTAGTQVGEYVHTLTTAELAVHTHGVTDPTHQHNFPRYTNTGNIGGGGDYSIGNSNNPQTLDATAAASTGISINNAGSGTAHNNVQPVIGAYMWTRTA